MAGAIPCSPRQVTIVAQRKVMKSLGFGDKEIDPKSHDTYFRIFGQLLSDSHMTAIFSWKTEEVL